MSHVKSMLRDFQASECRKCIKIKRDGIFTADRLASDFPENGLQGEKPDFDITGISLIQ
jgi:hypothetical protein